MKNIALCGVAKEISESLKSLGKIRIYTFADDEERRGDIRLAYALQEDLKIDLAVIGYNGAAGLTACDYLREQSNALPILWLCNKAEFAPEAKALNVDFYHNDSSRYENLSQIISIVKKYL